MSALAEARKWGQTIRISWSQQMAYKLHFVLLVVGPTLVFFFVKYNVWSSIYAMEGVTTLAGYDRRGMIAYQAWVLVVALLAQGYNAMGLSEDIRLGRISSYLVYPFDFWQFHTASFLAFQCIQLAVAGVTIAAAAGSGLLTLPGAGPLAAGLGLALLVGLYWFAVSYTLGLTAFWLEESWVLRVMFGIVSTFLSGGLFPLDLFPAWLRALLLWTPFPYATFVPVQVLMERYDGDVRVAAAIVAFWTLAITGVAALVWRRGLRLYTAAGM